MTDTAWVSPIAIEWSSSDAGRDALRQQAELFLSEVDDEPWSVLWCAGVGVMGTSSQALQRELDALRGTLDVLASAAGGNHGSFFFASSAGGVYAGVDQPPYDESSPVRPLTEYGEAKLNAESLISSWSAQTGTPSLIGRIANLYGPGQNLKKSQGLISQICRSHLIGQPLSIYVPLDTLRDNLYAPDCARLIVAGMNRLREQRWPSSERCVTKILASQRAITIGALLGEIGRIFKRSSRIVTAQSTSSAFQVSNLNLRSRVWPEIDRGTHTPLPVGIANTAADLLRQLQAGTL